MTEEIYIKKVITNGACVRFSQTLLSDLTNEFLHLANTETITIGSNITTTGYAVERRFIFSGTDKVGLINSMKLCGFRTSGSGTFSVRVVNSLNADVICEITGQTNIDDSVLLDMGTLSNLPTDPTILEIQGLNSNGSTTTFLSSLNWFK